MKVTARVQRQLPEAKTTEVEDAWQLTCATTDLQWQAAHNAQVQMALINAENLAHGLSVKLSPCMSSHSSYPSWRNDGNLLAYVIRGEDIATYT